MLYAPSICVHHVYVFARFHACVCMPCLICVARLYALYPYMCHNRIVHVRMVHVPVHKYTGPGRGEYSGGHRASACTSAKCTHVYVLCTRLAVLVLGALGQRKVLVVGRIDCYVPLRVCTSVALVLCVYVYAYARAVLVVLVVLVGLVVPPVLIAMCRFARNAH